MQRTITLIVGAAKNDGAAATSSANEIEIASDIDPREVSLEGVERVNLHFPKFTDGRAYSQAFLLRRRLQFKGEIRAHGDVLIDQLVQMQRAGFGSAVLRADQDVSFAQRQFERFSSYYQGDAVDVTPHFQPAWQRDSQKAAND